MQSIKRVGSVPGAFAVLVLVIVVAYPSLGARSMLAAPTVVVTLNLQRVVAQLDERAESAVSLEEMRKRAADQDVVWQQDLEALEAELKAIPATQPESAEAKRDKLRLKVLEYNEWVRLQSERLDIETSLLLRDLYRSVQGELAELCEVQGYDIVLIDDSRKELIVNKKLNVQLELQVRKQLSERRVLYASPNVDITDALIERMNNKFAAGNR